jgi:hypothetical protein
MNLNVLKLLRCYWKQPIDKKEFKAVNYYVQYERVNHIQKKISESYGDFRYVTKHEDEYDLEIYKALYQSIETIPNIKEFHITTHETLLFDEDKNRALFSNIAFGYDYKDLRINTLDNSIALLSTRLFFADISNENFQNLIFPVIPFVLNLNLYGTIPSLIKANFLDRDRVDQILDKENGFDFSRFGQ